MNKLFQQMLNESQSMSAEELQALKTQIDNKLGAYNYADTSMTQQQATLKQIELTNKAEAAYKAKKFGDTYNINDLRMELVEA